jgi:hypothetical protein
MRRNLLIVSWLFVASLFFSAQVWAVCPEEPLDAGECDTLYVGIHGPDQDSLGDPPYFVRFPIRLTHDVVESLFDSLASFVIPLCYDHSNPAAYCSLSSWWNTTSRSPYDPQMARSIFRELDGEANWFCSIYPWWMYPPLEGLFLDLDGTSHFWLSFVPTGSGEPRMPEVCRGLLATMTFKMEDTATVCIDSCFWPPARHLAFCNSAAQTYVPRENMPVCKSIGGFPATWVYCPGAESRSANGTYQSGNFQAYCDGGYVTDVLVWGDLPPGITQAEVIYTVPPEATYVEGYVTYTVGDHCQAGGDIRLAVFDNVADGPVDDCLLHVVLVNNPPGIGAPDTLLAVTDAVRAFRVYGSDPDGDVVPQVQFDAFWYEPDSLRPPVYPPSYDEGNPGFFTWAPTESEMGAWISSFWATDACGAGAGGRVTILVGPLYCGNMVEDGLLDLADVIFLANYLYRGGPAPDPLCKTDVNCDGVNDLGDYVYLVNYLYKLGPAPCFDCCAGGF